MVITLALTAPYNQMALTEGEIGWWVGREFPSCLCFVSTAMKTTVAIQRREHNMPNAPVWLLSKNRLNPTFRPCKCHVQVLTLNAPFWEAYSDLPSFTEKFKSHSQQISLLRIFSY